MSLFDSLVEPLRRSAQVNTIYGEPITAAGKTIIPVASVGYGFGVGVNSETETEGEETEDEVGLGGGGGVGATPIGVLEVSDGRTRFIPFTQRRRLVAAFLLGAAAGYWFHQRRHGLLSG